MLSRADCGRIWGGKSIERAENHQLAVTFFREIIGNNESKRESYSYASMVAMESFISAFPDVMPLLFARNNG